MESGIAIFSTEKTRRDERARNQEEKRKAAAEHEKSMQLPTVTRAEEFRLQPAELTPEIGTTSATC